MSLIFEKNKFKELNLDFSFPCKHPINCHFINGNEINILTWNQATNRKQFSSRHKAVDYDDIQGYSLFKTFFSRNEKIGRKLLNVHYVKHSVSEFKFYDMRDLFIKLKNLTRARGDTGQENIITSYISLIEYAQVKNDNWYKSWQGWQDWLLLWWRGLSSNFYMSWLRPIIWLIIGYSGFSIIPFLFLNFDKYGEFCWFSKYGEFWLYSPAKLPFYIDNLKIVLGENKYKEVLNRINEGWLSLISTLRLAWITLCAYAFKNAIGIYKLK